MNIHPQPARALTIAFIGHVILIGLFAFNFKIKPLNSNPSFTFLGAILHKQELSGRSTAKAIPDIKSGSSDFTWIKDHPRAKAVDKPSVSDAASHSKILFKPPLVEQSEKPSTEKKEETLQDQPPAYQPLRMENP